MPKTASLPLRKLRELKVSGTFSGDGFPSLTAAAEAWLPAGRNQGEVTRDEPKTVLSLESSALSFHMFPGHGLAAPKDLQDS
jgi:hypothetical protein